MIVAFVGAQGSGQTFMEWSFHFLQDHQTYWNREFGEIPLQNDPTNQVNAHGHQKNHPCGMEAIKDFIKQAKKKKSNDITFYPWISDNDQSGMEEEYRHLASYLSSQKIKQIWIKPTLPYPYFFERTDLDASNVLSRIRRWLGDQSNDIIKIRENISLRLYGNRRRWLASVNSLHLDVDKLTDLTFTDTRWHYDTEWCVRELFRRLDLKIHEPNIEHWRMVASKWQKNLENLVQRYERDIPMMAQMIIEGHDFDLTPFQLNYVEEAVLMSHLMRKFGRRLMITTENFPKNAKNLHKLLK